jgi:hypothetical protein
MNKRKLKNILRRIIREGLGPDEVSHFDRLPESALEGDTFIPAGTLEEILEVDGYREFREELAMMCEMLENGDQAYHVMEPAEHQFIRNSMLDMAQDGDMDFDKWLERSAFERVFIGDEPNPSMVRWTMP